MRSNVESHRAVKRPRLVMPENQIITLEESIDFPSTDVTEDSRLDDKLINDAMDLISKLPQPILHHILGFLQAQDTAPVATMSKIWCQFLIKSILILSPQVWNTLPFIDFDGPVWKYEHGKMKPWLSYVDSILSHRKIQGVIVDKFRIGSGTLESFESYLDHWITTLRDLHVRDLCFRNYYYLKKDGCWYCTLSKRETSFRNAPEKDECLYCTLPESIFSLKSINSLELLFFNLTSLPKIDKVNWPLLRKLHLKSILLSDDAIHNIISNCCAIEDLKFEDCIGLKVIKISSLVKLHKFVMRPFKEFPKVEINSPSLQFFSYVHAEVDNPSSIASCTRLQTSESQSFSYVCAEVNNCFSIASCTSLQTLVFSGGSITQGLFDKLFSFFPLLESLTVGTCNKLVKINISSCKLKCFKLDDCVNLVESNINTPNLTTFLYIGTSALSWSLDATPQLQVNVKLRAIDYSKNPGGCAKVTYFLRMIGYFEVVRLACHHKSLSFSKDIKDELIYSQCNLKNLLLDFRPSIRELTVHDATRLLDNLLWIYSQLEKLSIYARKRELPAIELLYERLNGEDRLDCCDSVPIRCWRHFLKEVKLETVNSDEARKKGFYDKEKVLKFKLKPREW